MLLKLFMTKPDPYNMKEAIQSSKTLLGLVHKFSPIMGLSPHLLSACQLLSTQQSEPN